MTFSFTAQKSPATEAELAPLISATEFVLPDRYLYLLRHSHGGEWPLPVWPFTLDLFTVDTIIRNLTATDFGEVYPDFLPIGGDGMSAYICLDFRETSGPAVVAIDASEDDNPNAAERLADTFDAFVTLIGRSAD